ncbi:hypothetical protein [Paenibacillus hubeiensis]|uniref:hypothetical protein n=1 Tax=Paenibacillus hubeiensis TaxID=3077330 RepID=UPI0031BA17F0
MSRYPWRDTSPDIAGGQPPQWETPQGAQKKADKALEEAKEYTDQQNVDFTAHIQNTVIHVTQADKDNWNSKAAGNHTHPNATPTTPGFMSAADKQKLNGIENEANHYVHPVTHPPSIIAQDASNRFVTDAEKATWNGKAETTEATTTSKGLMSPADKLKLNGIEEGAEVNQNAFAQVNNVVASDPSDTLSVVGGVGITITTNPNNKELTVTATGSAAPGPHGPTHTEYGADPIPSATVSEGGLMSSADKSLLHEITERIDTPERKAVTLQPGISVVSAEQDAAFRLAGLQGHTELNYQSQIGIYGVLNPYVIRYGLNLLPPFYEWSYPSTAAKYSSNAPYELVFLGNGTNAVSLGVRVPVLPSTTYTIQVDSGGVGQIGLNAFSADGTSLDATAGAPFGRFTHADEITFTTPASAAIIQVLMYRASDALEPVTFKNPVLNIGNTALPFLPREDTMLALQTELHAHPDTGANPDMVFERDGQYFTLAKWRKVVLDGSLSWIYTGTSSGFKNVSATAVIPGYAPISYIATKYNGNKLSVIPTSTNPDAIGVGTTGNLFISIKSEDSGWGDAYTPTADEIKAYFMGWRMCDANGNTYVSGTKYWRDDLGGTMVFGSTAVLPVTKASNYTPYQLLYQLATPVVESITSEGQLTFFEGDNQVEVGTGIVLRESVKPFVSSGYAVINNIDAATSLLKFKTNAILAVYKNGQKDSAWKIVSDSYANGKYRAYLPTNEYDPSAAYSVTYLKLDKYPSTTFDGTYAENEKALLLDTVRTLQENITRISVLESKKAEKDNPAWIAPTLLNGWVAFGSMFRTAQFYKDANNVVHVRGFIKSGSAATIFIFPKGYRPHDKALAVPAVSATSSDGTGITAGTLNILPDGQVQPAVNIKNGFLTLEGITFLAEQ